MNNFKKGFTLAEVLITLGVIGVVAALTMPTLITNYQKKQVETQLKKAYSEIAQAIQKAESEHGLLETWDTSNFDNALERATYFGNNYLFQNIKTVEKCVPSSNACWSENIVKLSGESIDEGGTASSSLLKNSHNVSYVTASGYSVYYWLHRVGNGMWYVVDVNGLKKPNKIGKDIFAFNINWGKVDEGIKIGCYPAGLDTIVAPTVDDIVNGTNLETGKRQYRCNKESDQLSLYCTALIALDGWKISDDYPW